MAKRTNREMAVPQTVRTVPSCVPIVPFDRCNRSTESADFVAFRFESPEDAFRYADLPIPRKAGFTSSPTSRNVSDWAGYETWDQYRSAVQAGDRDLLAQARKVQDELERTETFQHLYGVGTDQAYDVCGASVDVGLFVDGEPECMLAFEDGERGNDPTILRLGVHTGALGSVSAEDMLARSVGIAALVDLIESRGVRVELWSVASAQDSGYVHNSMIKVKRPEHSMALERLALFCGHPSMHRRLNFSLRERDPQSAIHRMCCGGGYGSTCEASEAVQAEFDLYLPHITRGNSYPDAQSIADWIEAVLQANTIVRDLFAGAL